MNILLIDLSSLVYPLYHMSGREPDPDWTSLRAIEKVHALASSAEHVAVCADGLKSFRREIAPSYKANRPEKDAVLIHQLRQTEDRLRADGFPVWKAEGYEADDLIASAVNAWAGTEVSITVATSDKDLTQLVCDSVLVRSLHDDVVRDAEGVKAKLGVWPDQMRDYLTMVGDASDNIAGVKGIGTKTATALLAEFGTLDRILEAVRTGTHTDAIKPAIYKALAESGESIQVARDLITLRTDAPIDFSEIYATRQPAPTSPGEDTMSEPLDTPATIVDDSQPEPSPAPEVTQPSEGVTTRSKALITATPEVEPYAGAWEHQLEPRSPADARTMAKWVHQSAMFRQFGSPEAVFSIVLAGRELGLGTMASLRGFHVVEGKPTMAADLIRALVLASGKAEYFVCTERTDERATWKTQRKGDPQPVELTFTKADAITAGVIKPKSAWEKHLSDMLAKTASAKLCRLVYSDVTFGLYATEELE